MPRFDEPDQPYIESDFVEPEWKAPSVQAPERQRSTLQRAVMEQRSQPARQRQPGLGLRLNPGVTDVERLINQINILLSVVESRLQKLEGEGGQVRLGYGPYVFGGTVSVDGQLRTNGKLSISGRRDHDGSSPIQLEKDLPVHANNDQAVAAGMRPGEIYRDAQGVLRMVFEPE